MNQYLPQYRTNSYIDKMFCIYCNKCTKPHCYSNYITDKRLTYDKNLCHKCDKTMFGKKTINIYTPKIPPKINYSYINSLFPNKFPYIYYYGSYNNKLVNHC